MGQPTTNRLSAGRTAARLFSIGAPPALLGLLFAVPAMAHEKWFVSELPRGEIPVIFRETSPLGLLLSSLAALSVGALYLLDRRAKATVRFETITRFLSSNGPTLLAIATAIGLFASALDGTLLATNLLLRTDAFGRGALALELLAALLLVIPRFRRYGALLLEILFVAALFLFGWNALDYLVFAGIAIFFRERERNRKTSKQMALEVLRIATGLSLLVLALGKFIRPDLHLEMLERYADWNPYVLLQPILPFLTKEWYVFCLALVETASALLILFRIFTRPVSLFLAFLFAASAVFLGPMELIGHLPIMAAMIVLGWQRLPSPRSS